MGIENIDVLYSSHFPEIFRYCYNLIKNKEEAEDISEESFVNAYYHYDPTKQTSFRTYIYRIAENRCKDYFRSKKYKQSKSTVSLYEIPVTFSTINPNTEIEKHELLEIFYKCLDQLKVEEKQSIKLYHIDNFTLQEITQIIGKSINTVRNRMNSGLKKLKICLKKKGVAE